MEYEGTPEARNEIVIRDLVKVFGDVKAVNGLSLDIRKGEMFGFLGPNGAGKTTTISMLCGLLEPTAGSAQIAGFDITEEHDTLGHSSSLLRCVHFLQRRFSQLPGAF